MPDRTGRTRSRRDFATVAGALPPVIPAKIRVPTTDALPRERLESRLQTAWRYRLTLVVAPAGSGKTTLLARFAAAAAAPVAWYRAETWDADEPALVRHLEAALRATLPAIPGDWEGVDDAVRALEGWTGGPALLVIDDLHSLEGTAAEDALGRFVEYAPPWLAILAASRTAPGLNTPRLRVSGELQEIGPDDLRFRAWEVERLFRDYYREPVPPADLAILARRTEGWAAGLQLFHLATRGKSAEARRRVLSIAGSNVRLVREYLARNVLADLPDELREFLVDTSVLGRLSGALCDELRARPGSAALLEELSRRQIFTVEIDAEEGSFRYHEVLRSHLDRMLVESLGEEAARGRHARAAALLEASGALPEALSAYCRAEDWPAVRRVLGGQGERLAGGSTAWLDALPPAIARHDPWVALASARGARAEGRWTAALEGFTRAEAAFGPSETGLSCRHERLTLAAWFDPMAIPSNDWTGLLRSGLVREPLVVRRKAGDLTEGPLPLVRGLLALAAGDVASACRDLATETDTADDDPPDPALAAAMRLAEGVAALLAGDADGIDRLEAGIDQAEAAGMAWLARIGRMATALDGPYAGGDAKRSGFADDDLWGVAISDLVEAWARLTKRGGGSGPRPASSGDQSDLVGPAERAVAGFRRLGAAVPEAWARGLLALALAETGADEARDAALAAESVARSTGTPGALLLAYDALSLAEPGRAAEYDLLADGVRRDTGLLDPVARRGRETNGLDEPPMTIRIRTLGGFGFEVDGRRLNLDRVKPRARAVLHLLAVYAGSGVHREVICAALWPDADAQTGARSLHVAISALRGALAEQAGPAMASVIARNGDAYRLALDDGEIDLRRFDKAMIEGRATRGRADAPREAFGRALGLYAGDLLPEDGPAEWVVERREHYRAQAVEAARGLADEALIRSDFERVVTACRTGLEIDRYDDSLWRILIQAHDRAGDAGAATRDRREYAAVLADLGLDERQGVSAY